MALSFMSIIFASVTALTPPPMDAPHSPQTVKYTQLHIEPEDTDIDPRVERAGEALAQEHPDTDLSMLIYVKYGLHNMEFFQSAAREFASDLGASVSYENPKLRLQISSLSREITDDGESEIFGLTMNEGSTVLASSRTTINCQGENIAAPIKGLTVDKSRARGCLIDSATVNEMLGRLADKI